MKKTIVTVAVIAGLGLAGLHQAYAGWGNRGGQNWNGPQYQSQAPVQVNQMDPAVQKKIETFFESTLDLRKEMAMKRAEKQALLRSDNPDPAALSKVEGELFDLRTTMHQKAVEADVVGLLGPRGGFGAGAYGKGGMNGGKGGRKGNPGYCPGYGQGRF